MSEPLILPIKPGTLTRRDRAALTKAGILVIEHPEPHLLRLIKAELVIDSSAMSRAALHALCSEPAYQGGAITSAGRQQALFAQLLKDAVWRARPAPSATPADSLGHALSDDHDEAYAHHE